MIRVTFRVFGKEGHRQRASFGKSFEFNTPDHCVYIECLCEDRTFTNRYVDVIMINDIEKEYVGHFKSIKDDIEEFITIIKCLVFKITEVL